MYGYVLLSSAWLYVYGVNLLLGSALDCYGPGQSSLFDASNRYTAGKGRSSGCSARTQCYDDAGCRLGVFYCATSVNFH